MAEEQFELNAKTRTLTGKSAARRLRKQEDRVPGTLYGSGRKPLSITLLHKDLLQLTRHEAIFSSILTLRIDDDSKKHRVIFKAIQRHHTKPKIMHIDFQRIKASEKLTMTVPLHFIGESVCPGVVAGGIVSHLIASIDVRCLPEHLPQYIEVDASHLELDQFLYLSNLKLPEGVELTIAHLHEENDTPVLNVHMPFVSQADIEAEAAEADLAATAAAKSETTEQTESTKTSEKSKTTSDTDTEKE